MTLFDSPSQYRENAAIRRIFALLPLYSALARGYTWRWFAVNISMDLRTGGLFTGDLDIVAKLRDHQRKRWFYRTWEVKVSLLEKDGSPRSLKAGKVDKMLDQLRAHREFGSPDASLLEVYVCEAGFWRTQRAFPPPCVVAESSRRAAGLQSEGFGYEWLPFEHDREGDDDVGLLTMPRERSLHSRTELLRARQTPVGDGFRRLADRLDECFEKARRNALKDLIMFCRQCKQLQMVSMKDGETCPACDDDLLTQS